MVLHPQSIKAIPLLTKEADLVAGSSLKAALDLNWNDPDERALALGIDSAHPTSIAATYPYCDLKEIFASGTREYLSFVKFVSSISRSTDGTFPSRAFRTLPCLD